MVRPIRGSKRERFFLRLKEKLDKWWVKFGIGPFIISLPAWLVNSYTGTGQAKAFSETIMPTFVTQFLANNPTAALNVAPIWFWFCALVYGYIVHRARIGQGFTPERFAYLFETLEKVVSSKALRFGQHVRQFTQNGGKDSSTTFLDITQPEQQIALLTEGLQSFFSQLYPGVSIKAGVARIDKDGHPTGWEYWAPMAYQPRTEIKDLDDPNSTLRRCISKGTVVVIMDRQNPPKGCYKVTELDADNKEGSLICCPVIYHHGGPRIPYVINITADQRNCFKKDAADLFEWIINHFTLRMSVEHSLLLIKQDCLQQNQRS